jgi:hypothetical protein
MPLSTCRSFTRGTPRGLFGRGEHAHYGISDKEMTAEEWKRLYVAER